MVKRDECQAVRRGGPSVRSVDEAVHALRLARPQGQTNGPPTPLLQQGVGGAVALLHRAITAVWRSSSAPGECKNVSMIAYCKGSGDRLGPPTDGAADETNQETHFQLLIRTG